MGWYKDGLVGAFFLPPSPAKLTATFFRDSASEEIQPKQVPLRPASPQVLELPGGASHAVRMRNRSQPPPPARKYVGKILVAVTITGASQLKKCVKP